MDDGVNLATRLWRPARATACAALVRRQGRHDGHLLGWLQFPARRGIEPPELIEEIDLEVDDRTWDWCRYLGNDFGPAMARPAPSGSSGAAPEYDAYSHGAEGRHAKPLFAGRARRLGVG